MTESDKLRSHNLRGLGSLHLLWTTLELPNLLVLTRISLYSLLTPFSVLYSSHLDATTGGQMMRMLNQK